MKISAPWYTMYHEFEALFGKDPDIRLEFIDAEKAIVIYVDNPDKAAALTCLLPTEKTVGAVTVSIRVVPANLLAKTDVELFEDAFRGNPALSYIRTVDRMAFGMSYVVFKNEVVQFFNDDLGDINGNCSTLYENIAQELFEDTAIHFCTDAEGNPGEPVS